MDSLSKRRNWKPKKTHLTKKLKDSLAQYKLLTWATQILMSVAEFSIRSDVDGVISTTIGSIVALHIHFYEVRRQCIPASIPIIRTIKLALIPSSIFFSKTVEEVLVTLKPLRFSVHIDELIKLVNLLTEYRKSLVFFYINYSESAK